MKIGVFGDIHNNIEALRAAYGALEKAGCDATVCLGDVVGYGASPEECIDFVRERNIPCVRGNHDHYTVQPLDHWAIQPYAKRAIEWMKERLSSDYMDWLDALPFTYEMEGIQFVHASLETSDGSCWPYILNQQTAIFHFFMQKTRFCFFGHTHIPLLFTSNKGQVVFELLSDRRFPGAGGAKYLMNPGSVGQPRDFDVRASAAVFDTKTRDVELIRVEYDVEGAQKKIIDAGLPESLAKRLSMGS
jgi:diadenosine tetraphosphatase ApaH/serine/threonine PP2A family protein phosphatase